MKDSPDVQRAITQTIKLHLYTGRHDSRDKRQVPVNFGSYQNQDLGVYLRLDGVRLRLCPIEI